MQDGPDEHQPASLRTEEISKMASDASRNQAAASPRWRISVEEIGWSASLGDYFERLGLAPAVRETLAIEIETALAESELEEFIGSWVLANGVPVQLQPVAEPARLLDLAQPLMLPPPRIGELLVRKGFITEEQLAGALQEARETNELLGVVLLRKQLIFEEELARTLSEQLSIPYISIMRCGVDQYIARMLPYDVGLRAAAIPVRDEGRNVQVAFADPTDPAALSAVRERIPSISVAVAELSDIKAALRSVAA
jgi:hypothetical protein